MEPLAHRVAFQISKSSELNHNEFTGQSGSSQLYSADQSAPEHSAGSHPPPDASQSQTDHPGVQHKELAVDEVESDKEEDTPIEPMASCE